jgi:hypothetical protein
VPSALWTLYGLLSRAEALHARCSQVEVETVKTRWIEKVVAGINGVTTGQRGSAECLRVPLEQSEFVGSQ